MKQFDHYDLGNFRTSMGGKRKFSALAASIKAFNSVVSSFTDLKLAQEILKYASDIGDKSISISGDNFIQDDGLSKISGALIQHAVILYCRATTTTSNHRGLTGITSTLSEELQAEHRHITKLRDDAIAHFGPGNRADNQAWAMETSVLSIDRDEMGCISFVYVRANWRGDQVKRLSLLVDETLRKTDEVIPSAREKIIEELEKIPEKYQPQLKRGLERNRFIPSEFFSSEDAGKIWESHLGSDSYAQYGTAFHLRGNFPH